MSRRNFADGMEITYQDLNAISSAAQRGVYDRLTYEMLQRKIADRFFGDSLLVEYATATTVTVKAGLGLQYDAAQVSPEPKYRTIYQAAGETLTLTGPDATNPRIDIVCVKANIVDEITASRKYKAPTTGTITTETLTVQKDWDALLVVVAGTPAGSPTAAAVPAGYIKIATLAVTALTAMSGAGAVVDNRVLVPVGGGLLIDSSDFLRLTAGVETSLDTLLSEIDTKLGQGGGGGGLEWYEPRDGTAPLEENEYGFGTYLFDPTFGGAQKLVTFLKVPSGYVAGQQVNMKLSAFSPSSSGTFLLKARTYLIKAGVSAVDTTTNLHTSTNTALTNTVAKQHRELTLDLTSSIGQVNAVAVAGGDMLRIELYRDVADTDTADVRFIPSATDPVFSA